MSLRPCVGLVSSMRRLKDTEVNGSISTGDRREHRKTPNLSNGQSESAATAQRVPAIEREDPDTCVLRCQAVAGLSVTTVSSNLYVPGATLGGKCTVHVLGPAGQSTVSPAGPNH
ncbi:unnamed protein product [Pleuronectes platessa]|uniref:Uncharacterized protein n=1 Tax=Pleuronectes platessa TaxID=8262 RepID=A0A9N7VKA0_PLEPL|nr:unnamed protein product [Pleuronectes platessa]